MMAESGQRPVYTCSEWEIDLARRELRAQGEVVPLGGRAFEILAELVRAEGDLVTKNDLAERVWRGVFVEESALRVHIAAIRRAFRADRDMLATDVGRGYRLLGSWQIRQTDAPLQSSASQQLRSTNIPNASFDLIGRATAIAHLWELLSAYRVVTLVGPGGIGKTALALEAARTAPPGFAADRLLVELASLPDPKLVCSAVASVLGIKLEGEDISPGAVARTVGARQLLLVLDNCEHVVDAVAQLADAIVSRCPGTTIVATSREALRIDGEHVYRVPPLDVPPESRVGCGGASAYTAVELFMTRARALGSNFAPDEENLGAVASICRRLDGIPLAIEFAAARAVMLSPAKIAVLLDDRFKFLTTGRRTALPRQQTLRATLDWSYDLLPEMEARILRQLGVFAGEFSLEAAIVVAGEGIGELTGRLANLVAKSLVLADIGGDHPHYRLLDTTRAYALDKLRACGELAGAARRLAQYYCGFLARAEADSETQLQAEWLKFYCRHIDSVRSGLDWAFSPEGDAQIGVALTAAAIPLWVQLSLLAECRERTELALAHLDDSAANARQLRMQLSAARAWSLMYGIGRAREAGPAWVETLGLAEQLGDNDYLLRSLWGLCIDQFNNGEFRKALGLARRFADVVAGSSNSVDRMMAERLLATTMHYLGDQRLAHRHIDRALARLSDLTAKPQVIRFRFDPRASAHYFQARILWLLGFADQALRVVDRNVEEGRTNGHALTFCSVLGQGACPIAFLAGDLVLAERYCTMLIEHTERHPIRLWSVWARAFRGMVVARGGDLEAGLSLLRKALGLAGEARFLPRFLLLLGELATCLGKAGEISQGLATIDEALARCEARDERWYVAELWRIKGELLLHAGAHYSAAAAEQAFDQASEVARGQGALFWELRTAISLARLRMSQSRPADARNILEPVYGKFTEGFEIADLRRARTMMAQLAPQ
ncbi:winged helix-turn-helix domain-containing protein [Bradyrhizobium sp. DOA1]|uniref:ATP-binding protein n=1 Tax=Bradyrhizobium sp. DOA1 TaxID=1126616 RepID=UPI00077C899D|nr:winged helix-turn-helix domain-containing protein [Bradyrhizobium sp. DOA1]KYG97521.1 transcriptional regulator [Bradyrhizobium sp. DOA1]